MNLVGPRLPALNAKKEVPIPIDTTSWATESALDVNGNCPYSTSWSIDCPEMKYAGLDIPSGLDKYECKRCGQIEGIGDNRKRIYESCTAPYESPAPAPSPSRWWEFWK